jgi:hypothetical protein
VTVICTFENNEKQLENIDHRRPAACIKLSRLLDNEKKNSIILSVHEFCCNVWITMILLLSLPLFFYFFRRLLMWICKTEYCESTFILGSNFRGFYKMH